MPKPRPPATLQHAPSAPKPPQDTPSREPYNVLPPHHAIPVSKNCPPAREPYNVLPPHHMAPVSRTCTPARKPYTAFTPALCKSIRL